MGPIQIQSSSSSSLIFTVQRSEPELVRPATPTPHETKLLSDIDDQDGLRFHFTVIQFYKPNPAMLGKDPAAVIRRAVAETLVYYYPLAGRLREGLNRKLMVDCTGEGVLFIEADADVRLSEFGEIRPPFACVDELLFDVPGSSAVLHSPLMLIQVTRLQCGGFILALRVHHCLCDATGLAQFMYAVAEIARGATAPIVMPVWERHVLSARSPPRVTCTHNEYKQAPTTITPLLGHTGELDIATSAFFFFGTPEISAIRRRHVPISTPRASRFEILAACLWKCRTVALRLDPDEEMGMICVVNVRGKIVTTPLFPKSYYGNALAFPMAVAPAGKLCREPLMYALDLVRKAKLKVNEEYMKSVADLMVVEGRPKVPMMTWTNLVSDVTRAGFDVVDFGWGKAVYAGPAKGGIGDLPEAASFYIPFTNKEGEKGIVVPICLPSEAMEIFVKELEKMLKEAPVAGAGDQVSKLRFTLSAL
ncbi:Benzyl alcohol O-benzoyltransferase [Linum grandiflorum]